MKQSTFRARAPLLELALDSACPAALQLLAVTTAVLELGPRVAAGDLAAMAKVSALAALLNRGGET